jgi:hypothetical protein
MKASAASAAAITASLLIAIREAAFGGKSSISADLSVRTLAEFLDDPVATVPVQTLSAEVTVVSLIGTVPLTDNTAAVPIANETALVPND